MRLFVKVVDKINKVFEIIVAVLLFAAFFSTFLQVIFRNLTSISIPWSDELSRYATLYIVYLAAGLAARKGSMIRMEVVPTLMKCSDKQLRVFYWIANIISIVFVVIVVKATAAIIPKNLHKPSASLGIPMAYIYYALPIGSIWMLINMFANIFDAIIKEKDSEKVEKVGEEA